jgi:hypothetical protein
MEETVDTMFLTVSILLDGRLTTILVKIDNSAMDKAIPIGNTPLGSKALKWFPIPWKVSINRNTDV